MLNIGFCTLFFKLQKFIRAKQSFNGDDAQVLCVFHFGFLVLVVLVVQDFGVIGAAVLHLVNLYFTYFWRFVSSASNFFVRAYAMR